jgi:hypothetical protein
MNRTPLFAATGLAAVFVLSAGAARADEGMWTYDNFPAAKVKADLGVTIDQKWLDRVQAASVRLTNGCSASVVSREGLVLTNHHCVVDCVQALSSEAKDYVQEGFLTDKREEELKCPGQQAEVLVSITDLTDQVKAAVQGKTGQDFVRARDAVIAEAEKSGCDDDRFRCQVVTLYRGGQYKLYKYRKYDDVRLAFAPEIATAFFGGDPDNFNFPRYNLDVAFVRLYENGKPVATPQHLTWTARAPKEGEATFVSGNPGSTDRLLTVAQLETQRDLAIPVGQLQRSEIRGRLIRFSEEGPEQKRIATDPLFSVENSFKVFFGRQFALNDKAFMEDKRAAEAELKAKVAADPALAADIGDPWAEIEAAQRAYADNFLRYRQIEQGAGYISDLFAYARVLVRAAQEREKPSAERLPEYAEARLPLLQKQLLDAQPVDAPLEKMYLSFWLSKTREYLTVDDPATKLLLGKESPEAMAERLVSGSTLADPAVRKALWEGGLAAVQASQDPLIQLALRMDPAAREVRKVWEEQVSGPTDRAAERIARARFAVYGDAVYPDATFSLRLSYGKVAGWTHRGVTVPATTSFAGLYERATGADPFKLASRWVAAKDKLDPSTVYNFVTTNDIIGGNSGSPVVSAKGEVLGAAFDGNIHSLGGAYGYDGSVNRTVVVSTAAATEALEKVYGRTALVKELTARR